MLITKTLTREEVKTLDVDNAMTTSALKLTFLCVCVCVCVLRARKQYH